MSFSLLKSPCHPCDRITLDGGGGTIAAVISIARRLKFGAALWHFSDMAFLFGDVRSKGAGSTGAKRKLSALSEHFAFPTHSRLHRWQGARRLNRLADTSQSRRRPRHARPVPFVVGDTPNGALFPLGPWQQVDIIERRQATSCCGVLNDISARDQKR